MANYAKITDFAAKDSMLTGNPLKEITGTAHDNEYNAIAAAVATKVDSGGALGTPSSGTLTNCTGLPTAGIVDASVTYAKIQNVSATDKLLGRATAGAGVTEEIACTAFARSILDDADEAAFKATTNLEIGVDVQAYDADTAKLDVAQSWTAKQTFGTTVKFEDVIEKGTITGSAPTGTFDITAQGVQYFTSNASTNWTQNFSNVNANVAVGDFVTVTILVTQGATGYLPTTIQVDGSAVTAKYLSGTAWTADASCVNAFTFTLIKTADATFTVLASKSKFATV